MRVWVPTPKVHPLVSVAMRCKGQRREHEQVSTYVCVYLVSGLPLRAENSYYFDETRAKTFVGQSNLHHARPIFIYMHTHTLAEARALASLIMKNFPRENRRSRFNN